MSSSQDFGDSEDVMLVTPRAQRHISPFSPHQVRDTRHMTLRGQAVGLSDENVARSVRQGGTEQWQRATRPDGRCTANWPITTGAQPGAMAIANSPLPTHGPSGVSSGGQHLQERDARPSQASHDQARSLLNTLGGPNTWPEVPISSSDAGAWLSTLPDQQQIGFPYNQYAQVRLLQSSLTSGQAAIPRLEIPEYYAAPSQPHQNATTPVSASGSPLEDPYPPVGSSGHLHPLSRPHSSFFSYHPGNLASMNVENGNGNDMHTPVSPVSPHNGETGVGEQLPTRKRSHSVMSQHHEAIMPELHHHSRAGSMVSGGGVSQQEDFASPRGSRTVKRDVIPQNADGKYCCEFSQDEPCWGQPFDRKCEWSKHMDKHDRPYRCHHKSCEKLQGFTYSGGLLRHQREVHGAHGGPKATLMCPFAKCRRHEGKGFTRKENLNEHLRRVHQVTDQNSQLSQYPPVDAALGGDDAQTPGSRISEGLGLDGSAMDGNSIAGKRKRSQGGLGDFSAAQSVEDLLNEIQQLREENKQKNQRIHEMQLERIALDEQMRSLQSNLQTALEQSAARE